MVPFVALISGRLRFTRADINWVGLSASFALYGVLYWMHDLVRVACALFHRIPMHKIRTISGPDALSGRGFWFRNPARRVRN
jgi:hypothetical protein